MKSRGNNLEIIDLKVKQRWKVASSVLNLCSLVHSRWLKMFRNVCSETEFQGSLDFSWPGKIDLVSNPSRLVYVIRISQASWPSRLKIGQQQLIEGRGLTAGRKVSRTASEEGKRNIIRVLVSYSYTRIRRNPSESEVQRFKVENKVLIAKKR